MRCSTDWEDYALLDTTDKERLERWGSNLLIRPDPQVLWHTPRSPLWNSAVAHYYRSKSGGGHWEYQKPILSPTIIRYKNLRFRVSPTDFKHMGLFPEQAVNWDFFTQKLASRKSPVSVLNLFAYTGGATLACAAAGAEVCHVDASKGMVQWARENAVLSSLSDKPIRWIVDDCEKFVQREIRRNKRYDAIIMDPPSYGRGPNKEIWKLEDKLFGLLRDCQKLLRDNPLFFALNSYTAGFTQSVMKNLLELTLSESFTTFFADEIGIPVEGKHYNLPCGATALAFGKE